MPILTGQAPTISKSCWQLVGNGAAITFTEKGIGLEVVILTFDGGKTPSVCVAIPPEHVGSLAKAVIAFITNGSIAIMRE